MGKNDRFSMISRKLKSTLAMGEAYAILDGCRASGGGTWLAGGCLLLAEAIARFVPTAELVTVLDAEGRPQHVAAKVGDWYVDGDGVSSRMRFLHTWEVTERIENATIGAFDRDAWRKAGMQLPDKESVGNLAGLLVEMGHQADLKSLIRVERPRSGKVRVREM